MDTLTYLCPCCNKAHEELKSISEIGFSLRNPFYGMLIDAIEKKANEMGTLSSDLEKVLTNLGTNDQFKYLSPADIEILFPDKHTDSKSYRGDMIVTCKWVKDKARTAWANRKIDQDYVDIPFPEDDFPGDNSILHQEEYLLFYHYVDGSYVPMKIQRLNDGPDDTQRYSSAMRRCSCGRVISRVTGTAREIIVVMQGSSRAGKSTTMVALENILNRYSLVQNSPIFIESNLENIEPEEKQLAWIAQQHKAFSQGIKIKKTEKDKDYEELIFSFRLVVNHRPYILTLVDMAGEIFDGGKNLDQNWYKNYSYIYQHCDAIWTSVPYQTLASSKLDPDFLLRHYRYYRNRPAQYEQDLAAWKGEASYTQELPNHEEFISDLEAAQHPRDVVALLDKYAPIHAARMLAALGETNAALANADLETYQQRLDDITLILPEKRPPHAVILTKTDSIADLFTDGDADTRRNLEAQYIYPAAQQQYDCAMHYYDPVNQYHHRLRFAPDDCALAWDAHTGTAALREEDINRVCRNVRKFFARTDAHRVRTFHELCPGKTCDFALSAYGRSANSSRGSAPLPYNVTLPLLWTLAVTGVLPVSYVQTTLRQRTPEETAADGTGLVVTEQTMVCSAVNDEISMENLFANADTYRFHESRS